MRLTYKAQDQHGKETGTVWYASTAGCIFPKSDKEEQALKKLAAYEDTGLSPEEFRERTESVLELYGKLKPYADAEEQGLLVRLPCKVGDVIWWKNAYRIIKCYVIEIQISDGWSEVIFKFGPQLNLKAGARFEDFGDTVFLTREEAEAALKGWQDDGT